ncbi:imidazolonepropionase [Thermanaerovibrio velox DSM 12556]|uniref:Imidazolonepropionase n=1 Tax=Thermanaerovibrio velox DSM 12556 TaxID=926567 RepID=H0URV3_9BACT|nr:imidazolonepropionase [Thermanaerovibrio velox]EHM10042.1 imidazolonepropionase [Thermanaerovibrio velox DSM 12556]
MTVKLFRNARIYTPQAGTAPLRGVEQGRIREIELGAILCRDGIIEMVGPEEEVLAYASSLEVNQEINLHGKCVIPGLVDPHTHMCFASRREEEFSKRLHGVPYLEILRSGGGILSSVRAVRTSSDQDLYEVTKTNAINALKHGTTTVEIKSGYGLDTESELRMLSVINRVGKETHLDVVATFMGAHAVPEDFRNNPDKFVDLLCGEVIPAAAEQGIARFCDVFCEDGVFSVDQSRRILSCARSNGFELKIHADEVHDLGGASLAAELRTLSAEHLLAASDEGLNAMAEAGVIAVLLPATAYSLKKPYARARRMIELGVPVALATDCNPGSCFCESMQFVFGLAVMNMGMSVEEALVGCTLNAAHAIGMGHLVGSLEEGKLADFVVLDGKTPATMAYHVGANSVLEVYKRGEKVV